MGKGVGRGGVKAGEGSAWRSRGEGRKPRMRRETFVGHTQLSLYTMEISIASLYLLPLNVIELDKYALQIFSFLIPFIWWSSNLKGPPK